MAVTFEVLIATNKDIVVSASGPKNNILKAHRWRGGILPLCLGDQIILSI
jgi:hypothetical protein